MAYPDPYSDSDRTHRHQTSYTGPSYNQNQYSDNNLHYNPYSQPTHPTYDEGGYGAESAGYTDEPTYPPQRQVTTRSQASGRANTNQSKEEHFSAAAVAPRKKNARNLRQYRYDHQGALWTRGGKGRCVGRFCCCSLMTIVFLFLSIVMALALWVRPPAITIGDVAPVARGGSQISTQSTADDISLTIHLALNISVNNPSYFSVNFKEIKVELFHPINQTAIGGGTSRNVEFPSNSQTNWTFPFDVEYNTASDPRRMILADLGVKCSAQSNLEIDYKITPQLQILFFTISPVVSNRFSFPCPLDSSILEGLGAGLSG